MAGFGFYYGGFHVYLGEDHIYWKFTMQIPVQFLTATNFCLWRLFTWFCVFSRMQN